jgi:hypothetical protein
VTARVKERVREIKVVRKVKRRKAKRVIKA